MGYTTPSRYALMVQNSAFSPVDATTYYSGIRAGSPQTTVSLSKIYIPKTGVIRAATYATYAGTATGTAEDFSLYIRKNNTSDALIATLGAATGVRVWENYNMSLAVAAGDFIEVKWVCPTWVTNPEGVSGGGVIYIECD